MEKTLKSLELIGPAVLNGGVTTFLALILCGWSASHTFVTFFKVRYYDIVKLLARVKTKFYPTTHH